MGMTRAQRYANHKGGRKRGKDGQELPAVHDPVKAECARIFRAKWEEVHPCAALIATYAKEQFLGEERSSGRETSGGGPDFV